MAKIRTEHSRRVYERATRVMPAGVSSNSRWRDPYPLYFRSASGATLVDVDGNRFIDLVLGNGAVVLGHHDPAVDESVRRGLETGLTIGVEWERTAELAELFLSVVPTMDKVRFTNTGTEAMLHALQLARAATGRPKVAKAEGSYHGWADSMFVSVFHDLSQAGTPDSPRTVPSTPGLDPHAVAQTLVFPFNDTERARDFIANNARDLAAVVLEPVMIDIGFVPARREYVQMLRRACTEHGVILIFDEVLTSFRLAPGGAQEYYGVTPDLAIYGKAMSNGYPIAAVAGLDDLMRLYEPRKGPAFVGTFNGHVIPVSAALGALPRLADGTAQKELEAGTERLQRAFRAMSDDAGISASFAGGAGHFQWYFGDAPVVDYRTAAACNPHLCQIFAQALIDQQIFVGSNLLSHQAISLAHSETTLDRVEHAMAKAMRACAARRD